MHDILLVLLSTSPVFVPVVAGQVSSLSLTHCGANDVVVVNGAEESWFDVRLRPDAPYARNAPVGVAVVVTMLVACRITTGMTISGTTTAAIAVSPAGITGAVTNGEHAIGTSVVEIQGSVVGHCAITARRGRGPDGDKCNCMAELAALGKQVRAAQIPPAITQGSRGVVTRTTCKRISSATDPPAGEDGLDCWPDGVALVVPQLRCTITRERINREVAAGGGAGVVAMQTRGSPRTSGAHPPILTNAVDETRRGDDGSSGKQLVKSERSAAAVRAEHTIGRPNAPEADRPQTTPPGTEFPTGT